MNGAGTLSSNCTCSPTASKACDHCQLSQSEGSTLFSIGGGAETPATNASTPLPPQGKLWGAGSLTRSPLFAGGTGSGSKWKERVGASPACSKWSIFWVTFCLFSLAILIYLVLSHFSVLADDPGGRLDDSEKGEQAVNIDGIPLSVAADLLLDDSLEPLWYNLSVQPFLCLDLSEYENPNSTCEDKFTGTVQILLHALQDTGTIKLHTKDLHFTLSQLSLHRFNDSLLIGLKELSFQPKKSTATIRLEQKTFLDKGEYYRLRIANFTARISRFSGRGFYISKYRSVSNATRFLATTQFEVAHARQAFPCFDEPRFKATFAITIIRRPNMKSLANTELLQSVKREFRLSIRIDPATITTLMFRRPGNSSILCGPSQSGPVMGPWAREDDWVEDHYAPTLKMSTYLVAFAVVDFDFKQTQSNRGVTIRAFARADAIDEVDHSLRMTRRMLEYLEDYFDIPYPMTKLDLIAVPDFSHGAMENWGLITFRESNMLYNASRDLRLRRQIASVVIGHELAHQWFGNLVTMHWWTDLWLNEAFAQYMGYKVTEIVDPEEPMETIFVQDNTFSALRLDAYGSTHAVVTEVYDPVEILQLFDSITYKKGSCLIRMMANFLGEAAFRKGLQLYLKQHSYGNAVSQDLWNVLDEVAHNDSVAKSRLNGFSLGQIMNNWVRLTGFPFVQATRNYSQSTMTVWQKRFVLDPMKQNLPTTETWMIPLTFVAMPTDQSATSLAEVWAAPRMVWLSNETLKLRLNATASQWVIANVNLQGFYRVNYDDANWRLIIDQLRTDHKVLPIIQRAQILDDAFEFSKAGPLDILVPLNGTKYLVNEVDYLPWFNSFTNLFGLDVMLQNTSSHDLLKSYVQSLIRPSYRRLSWSEGANDDKFTIYLRHLVLRYACYYGLSDCLLKTKEMFHEWMISGSQEHMPKPLRHVIACYGIQQGGVLEFEFAWRVYVSSTVPSDRASLLMNLACTRMPLLLNRLLDNALNESLIRRWDLPYLFGQLTLQNPAQRHIAWNFLQKNWNYLLHTLDDIAGRLSSVIEVFNEPRQLDEVLKFLEAHDLRSGKRKFYEALETIRSNIRWKARDFDKVVGWLKQAML